MAMSATLKSMGTSPITLTSSSSSSSPFLSGKKPTFHLSNQNICKFNSNKISTFKILAAKLPAGMMLPKTEPKFNPPFLGFTKTAEVWNSRACMIGLIGTFIVELILNKGILEVIGVDIGKGLDIPL